RFVFDGLEHRWDKWILDYDLEKQVDLFHRAAQQFSRDNNSRPGGSGGAGSTILRWTLALFALALLVGAARGIRRQRYGEATRGYLKLRRAYERAGFTN